eukprot:634452-Rhodomonas_salina.1
MPLHVYPGVPGNHCCLAGRSKIYLGVSREICELAEYPGKCRGFQRQTRAVSLTARPFCSLSSGPLFEDALPRRFKPEFKSFVAQAGHVVQFLQNSKLSGPKLPFSQRKF